MTRLPDGYILPDGYANLLVGAIAAGRTQAVHALLKDGMSPDLRTDRGWPAIALAAWLSQTEVVRALLAAGADPNARVPEDAPDSAGQTALHMAARMDIMRMLLDAGADPNIPATNGLIVLDQALTMADVEQVDLLLARGAVVPEEMRQPDYWTRFGSRTEPVRRVIFAHITASTIGDAMGSSKGEHHTAKPASSGMSPL